MTFRYGLVLAALLLPASGSATPISRAEAYRLDSLETKALNEAAQVRLTASERPMATIIPNPPAAPTPNEIALSQRVHAAIERWRERDSRCRAETGKGCD